VKVPSTHSVSIEFRYCVLDRKLLSYLHPSLLTPWSRFLIEKPAEKFPAFYGTRSFITALVSARHLYLSWATSIQSIPPSLFLKIHFNIILPSMPGTSKWSLSLSFPHQNPVYAVTIPHTCYIPRPYNSSRFDHGNNIWSGVHIIKLIVM